MKTFKWLLLLGLILIIVRTGISCSFFFRSSIYCTVVRVIDGDTIDVRTNNNGKIIRIRIRDINCPELHSDIGNYAKKVAQEVLPYGTQVKLEYSGLSIYTPYMDKYGRVLGELYVVWHGTTHRYSDIMLRMRCANWF